MRVAAIVAMTESCVIGKDNQLLWHIPEDLKRFKRLTMGCPIIMGRKTYESIGRALPGRENIVITRDPELAIEGVTVVRSVSEAMASAKRAVEGASKTHESGPDVFVIGGEGIYTAMLEQTDELFITLVHREFEGDRFFPEQWTSSFQVVERESVDVTSGDALPISYLRAVRSGS